MWKSSKAAAGVKGETGKTWFGRVANFAHRPTQGSFRTRGENVDP